MIYKILRAPEFAAFVAEGATAGAPADLADGFVHFSTAAQVAQTAAKHFSGAQGVWLLACAEADLGPELRWEPSRGGASFPHLYRRLAIGDVAWARPLPLRAGAHVFPDDLD